MNRYRFHLPVGMMFLLSLTLTAIAWFYSRELVKQKAQEDFDRWTIEVHNSIQLQMQAYLQTLYETRAFVIANQGRINRKQFARYVKASNVRQRYPAIQGIGFARKVRRSDARNFEAQLQDEGFKSYRIFPQSFPEGLAFPVTYIEPLERRNLRALGFDMSSEVRRREAMQRAQDSGRAQATRKILLAHAPPEEIQPGFNIYLPVYKPGAPLRNVEERRQALMGYIFSPFRFQDLAAAILPAKNGKSFPLYIEIFEGGQDSPENFVSALNEDGEHFTAPVDISQAHFRRSVLFSVGGERWLLRMSASRQNILPMSLRIVPWASVLIVLLLSLLWWALKKAIRESQRALENSKRASLREHSAFEKYRDLVDGIDLGIVWTAHPQTFQITFVSPSSDTILGYSPQDWMADREVLIKKVHPADREHVLESIGNLSPQNPTLRFDHRFLRKDLSYAWFHTGVKLVERADGFGAEIRGLSIEITPLREAEAALRHNEEKLRALTESIPHMMWTAQPSGGVDYFNRQWFEFTGQDFTAAAGWGWKEMLHPEDAPRVLAAWSACLLSETTFESEFRLRRRDGSYRWVLTRALPIQDSGGKIMQWFGTHTDVDDQKKLREEAVKAVSLRDEFLSIASHELRTPITPLKLQLQRVYQSARSGINLEPNSLHMRTALEMCLKQVDRLAVLIENLLDVSRIQQGKLQLSYESVDLVEVTREIVERFTLQRAEGGVVIFNNTEDTLMVECDRLRIEQVIVNLLSNARKYGDGKPIHISLLDLESRVQIRVEDHGIGIAPGNQQRIFERFERAHSHISVSGLGLGLYISQQILEAHQGHIKVHSALGEGAVFTAELPKHRSFFHASRPDELQTAQA